MRTPLHVLSTFLNCFDPSSDAKNDEEFLQLKDDFVEMRQVINNALGMVNDLTFATTFEVEFLCYKTYFADNIFINSMSSYHSYKLRRDK